MTPRPAPYRPLTNAERVALLAALLDVTRASDRLLWQGVVAFLDTGTPAADLAALLGMARPTFYRKVKAYREGAHHYP